MARYTEADRDDLITDLTRSITDELLAACDPTEEIDLDWLAMEAECEAVQRVERMERSRLVSRGENRIHGALADSLAL